MSNHELVQFNCHQSSKLYSLRVTNDKMRKAVLKAGFNSSMKINDFYRMKISMNGKEFNGQTILRNFGNRKRGRENAARFLKGIGLYFNPNASRFEGFDFTDPKQLRLALLKSKIDILSSTVTKFVNSKIKVGGKKPIELTGRRFLIEYKKALVDKNLIKPDSSYFYSKTSYLDLLNRAGFKTNFYTSLSDKSVLRRILESAKFDFENKRFNVVEFFRMKFNSYNHAIDGRNRGVFTGQGLLRHYFEDKANFRMEQILTMLKDAGYNMSHMEAVGRNNDDPFKTMTPKIAREILSSCTTRVDWRKVKVNDFRTLYFDSKYFSGKGLTILKRLGPINSISMRRLLTMAGFNSPIPNNWIRRLNRISKSRI